MSARRAFPRAGWGLALLLVTRLALGVAYSFVVPIWEAYDEPGHFAYVRYLAKYRQLLDPADPEAQAVYEKFQPPLYYVLVAPFLTSFDLGETQPQPELNPLFTFGNAGLNYALHPPTLDEAAAEIARAVRTARLVGVVISTLSVLFVYHMARRIWGGPGGSHAGPVWAATLLFAFWPQYLFIGSMITNDLAVTAFSTGVLALAVQLVTEGFRPGRALAMALLLAAAVLSKINALALLPVAVLAGAISLTPLLRRAHWRSPLVWLGVLAFVGVVAAAVAALGSLEFVTEQVLQFSTLRLFLQNLVRDPAARSALPEAGLYAFRTFYASFGWGNVETWPWLYSVWTAGLGLGLLGLAVGAWQRRTADGRVLLLLGLQVFVVLGVSLALVIALSTIHLAPGRYLLPALPAIIALMVTGWQALLRPLPARAQAFAWRGLALGAVLAAWVMPLATLVPTYLAPRPLVGAVDEPAVYTFGETIQVIGHQTPAEARPGETLRVQVCWQATAPVTADYTVFVEALGPDGQGYGRVLSYPGRGNYPTRFWTPGVPFCDRYDVPIDAAMPAPAQAWVRVALLRAPDANGQPLPVTDAHGQRVSGDAYTLPVKVAAVDRPPPPMQPLDYRFGDALRLHGYSLTVVPDTRSVRVSLVWEALRDLDRDYVVFVHLRDQPESAYAQADSEPRDGWYPTHLWRQGEVVEDTHTLTLPAGTAPPLSLYVGVVDPAADERLVALDSAGRQLRNDEVILLADWVLYEHWRMPASLEPPDVTEVLEP